VALLDNTQALTDTFSYCPYGEELSATGATPTPFRFLGSLGYYRDSADRSYVRARGYSHGMAAWVSPDPLRVENNGYLYARASPISRSDSFGLLSWGSGCKGDTEALAKRCLNEALSKVNGGGNCSNAFYGQGACSCRSKQDLKSLLDSLSIDCTSIGDPGANSPDALGAMSCQGAFRGGGCNCAMQLSYVGLTFASDCSTFGGAMIHELIHGCAECRNEVPTNPSPGYKCKTCGTEWPPGQGDPRHERPAEKARHGCGYGLPRKKM